MPRAAPTPHPDESSVVAAGPSLPTADPHADEKAELRRRVEAIVEAMRQPQPEPAARNLVPLVLAVREARATAVPVLPTTEAMAEAIDYIGRKINLGKPVRVAAGKAGPRSRDTQHTAGVKLRAALYAKLVRNPDSARAGGEKMREKARPMRDAIKAHALKLSKTVAKSERVGQIMLRCWKDGAMSSKPSEATVRRVLREIDATGR